jgi:tetratricopeptide (TPR) repeat protein
MNVVPRRPLFYQPRRSNIYRVFVLLLMVLGALWFWQLTRRGAIRNPFLPTPTPTRTAQSYLLEGETYFTAGYLEAAITAYREAARLEPENAQIWAQLARIQAYSSNSLTTDYERSERLKQALESANQAVALAPDDSNAHAIRAFVLDWNATAALTTADERASLLLQAEQAATRALQLDSQNALAMAFYAEILIDQQKWSQAEQVIQQALERQPDLLDVQRVYAYVLESTMRYEQAIQAYQRALELAPNLTFLYISIGANYRRLALDVPADPAYDRERALLYEQAITYFARAADINKQLQIKDPVPYIAIAKAYSQQGDFFAAALNIRKALEFDPTNADLYGQLGIIYQRARNYESAIPALQCALRGCDPETSCQARFVRSCREGEGVTVTGLPLSPGTVDYYLVYGSVLAALSRPEQNYCPEAVSVLEELLAAYGDNPIIAQNAGVGLEICRSLAESARQPPTPYLTPTPLPTPRP